MKNMMKKIAALTMMMTMVFALTVPATADEDFNENWGYWSTQLDWSEDFTIIGYFYNNNDRDVYGIHEFDIELYDSCGEVILRAEAGEDQNLYQQRIEAHGKVEYKFVIKGFEFNPAAYDFSNGYTVSIQCKYYAE